MACLSSPLSGHGMRSVSDCAFAKRSRTWKKKNRYSGSRAEKVFAAFILAVGAAVLAIAKFV